ncbi:MAG: hypothetical protein L0323_01900 [Planctomycetes bacterium]|nr:hypothetical protein [Planctomycetota bacterium]
MTLSRARCTPFGVFALALVLTGTAQAQIIPLFSENFEGPPAPPGNVGAYTEVDPFSGVPAPTLWHEEAGCGICPTGGYIITPNASPFSSIVSNPGAVLVFSGGDDGYSGRIISPFIFQHYGVAFQLIDINRNGFLTPFPGGGGGTDFINDVMGSPNPPNGVIGPWWDDTTHVGGQTLYEVQGSAPNRRFVVEWNNLEAFPGNGSGENATFQAVINETTNVLEFHYDNATFALGGDPWSATVGTESFNGTTADDATCGGEDNLVFPATGFDLTPGVPPPPTPSPLPSCMGTEAAAYNQGDIGLYTFNTFSANTGAIESPGEASTSALATVVMAFDYTKQSEGGGSASFDQCFVETSPTGLGLWTLVTQITGNTGPCGGPSSSQTLSLSGVAGTNFQHRFRFDTVDSVGNDYYGWYVDNIRVFEALPGPTVALFSENFEVGTVAGSTVGSMAEQDPAGNPTDTLWHAEANCDAGTPGSYTVAALPFAPFSSITGSPSAILIHGSGVDDSVGTIGLPIAFNFYGAPLLSANVDSNGPVSISAFSNFVNQAIPTPGAPDGFAAAWWDDNHTGPSGSVMYDVVGGSLVIEWNVEHYPNNGSGEFANFQVRLNPSPADTIDFLYEPATFTSGGDPWSSSIGVEDPAGIGGTDVTGFGAGNSTFPGTDVQLTFVPGGGGGTPIPPPLAGNAAAFNQGDLGNYTYGTGGVVEGALVSSTFCLPGGSLGTSVTFDYLKVTEGAGATIFDQCFVEARPSVSDPWSIVGQVAGNQTCAAGGATTTLSSTAVPSQIRLRFDSVDSVGNNYLGWYVDNLSASVSTLAVGGTAGAGCPSSGGCVPTIFACGSPTAGNANFSIGLGNAEPGTLGVLILSAGTTSIPVSLFIPGNTCTLLVPLVVLISPIPVSAGAGCSGSASVTLPVPCGTPAGIPLNAQWGVVQPGIFPAANSVSMTPRLELTTF